MLRWPVPDSFSKALPTRGEPGAFWEERGDRWHCGVDIYAPEGSEVVTISGGTVLEVGEFTSPRLVQYWNVTYYVLVRNRDGTLCRYAELSGVSVDEGDEVSVGDAIGRVGQVLNVDKIDDSAPSYIQALSGSERLSMLHLEVYCELPEPSSKYLGGNWFGARMPEHLLNPVEYFEGLD